MIKMQIFLYLLIGLVSHASAGTLNLQNSSITSNLIINPSTANYEKIKTDSTSDILTFDNVNCPITLTTSIEGEVARNNIYSSSINTIGVRFSSSLQNESVLIEAPFTQTFQLPSESGNILVQRAAEWIFLQKDNDSFSQGYQQIKSPPILKSVYSGECFDSVTSYATIQESSNVIFETCTLDSDSAYILVELGQIPKLLLNHGGTSQPIPFNINLSDCISLNTAYITFSFPSASSQSDVLDVYPSGTNIGIRIFDQFQYPVISGQPINITNILNSNSTLYFTAFVVGVGTPIQAGNFTANANFTISFH